MPFLFLALRLFRLEQLPAGNATHQVLRIAKPVYTIDYTVTDPIEIELLCSMSSKDEK